MVCTHHIPPCTIEIALNIHSRSTYTDRCRRNECAPIARGTHGTRCTRLNPRHFVRSRCGEYSELTTSVFAHCAPCSTDTNRSFLIRIEDMRFMCSCYDLTLCHRRTHEQNSSSNNATHSLFGRDSVIIPEPGSIPIDVWFGLMTRG